jgi:hypothetical protein
MKGYGIAIALGLGLYSRLISGANPLIAGGYFV